MAKLRSILIAFLILLPPSCHPKHTIIAVLELEHTSTDLPTLSWERGLEILPGAQVAIEHINHYYNISRNQFELKVINSGKCCTENYKEGFVIDFLNLTRHRISNQFALIGLFCSNAEQLVLKVAEQIGINPIVLSSSVSITSDSQASNNHRILPSADAFIDAFSSLILHLKHDRITVITQPTDSYFFQVAETLYHRATSTNAYKVVPFIQLHAGMTAESALQELQQFSSNIIFLSTNIDKTIDILCTANKMGLIWPQYGWVVHSIRLDDFTKIAKFITKCNVYYALEGVLLLNHKLNSGYYAIHHMFSSSYGEDYGRRLRDLGEELGIPLSPNPYSIVLYNSVLVYTLDVYTQMNNNTPQFIKNTRYTTTVSSSTNRVRLGIDIFQIKNGNSVLCLITPSP